MTFFSNAQNLTINGGQFMDTSTTINVNGLTGIDTLLEASCPEAAHDAASREYSPRCFPGTREQYIEDIVNWVNPTLGDSPTSIYWMKGPAGVGKSAVAQTCAEELRNRDKLGAAFFFSTGGHNQPEKFFPSIAYQLSTIHSPYRDLINTKIHCDKTLVKKTMSSQFRYLISEPLRVLRAQGKGVGKRIAVIVDGLDECEGADAQCEIIRIIASAATDAALPLCWTFFSRPEPHIEAIFAETTVAPHCYKAVLPISRDADGEIELYLRNGFENILKRRNTPVQSQWPSAEDMKTLVSGASGLFIYATTVIRFVDHLGLPLPQTRLRAIIDFILDRRRHGPHAGTNVNMPFAELDAFYILILKRIPMEIFPSAHLLLALSQWGSWGAIIAANTLGLSKDEFEAVCNHISAVVYLQDPGKDLELDPTIDTSCSYTQTNRNVWVKLDDSIREDLGGQVCFYHKSFRDFLLDPVRSGGYCVKRLEALAKRSCKLSIDYERTYCWEGSKLVPASAVASSAASLSYPYTSELINSLIKARVYVGFGHEDSQSFSILGAFGTLGHDRDFRKRLYVITHLWSPTLLPLSIQLWGCEGRSKLFPGTCVRWFALAGFKVDGFKLMIKQRKQANVIQRYHPKWYSRFRSLLRDKTQEHFESVLYRVGHGEKSIFWYWEIDYKLGHYRDFQTINLAEGEKRFREEDFEMWDEW